MATMATMATLGADLLKKICWDNRLMVRYHPCSSPTLFLFFVKKIIPPPSLNRFSCPRFRFSSQGRFDFPLRGEPRTQPILRVVLAGPGPGRLLGRLLEGVHVGLASGAQPTAALRPPPLFVEHFLNAPRAIAHLTLLPVLWLELGALADGAAKLLLIHERPLALAEVLVVLRHFEVAEDVLDGDKCPLTHVGIVVVLAHPRGHEVVGVEVFSRALLGVLRDVDADAVFGIAAVGVDEVLEGGAVVFLFECPRLERHILDLVFLLSKRDSEVVVFRMLIGRELGRVVGEDEWKVQYDYALARALALVTDNGRQFVALEDLQRVHLRLVSRVKETTGVDRLIAGKEFDVGESYRLERHLLGLGVDDEALLVLICQLGLCARFGEGRDLSFHSVCTKEELHPFDEQTLAIASLARQDDEELGADA
eukprot:scaffold29905_cov64-Phaeocystis_antarctica.AAC.10